MSRLLLVSNRLPVTVKTDGDRVTVTRSSGGIATGLQRPHEQAGSLWIGWPGDMSTLTEEQRAEIHSKLAELKTVPVTLTVGEVNLYYEEFANGVLWPLFHYLAERVPVAPEGWSAYQAVNEKFADTVAGLYQPGDLVWVHDYQLMLVPRLLRQRLPDARIGFFLHIPFPSSELFRVLPWRAAILEGVLGADLIGFHTLAYMRHFAASMQRILGAEVEVDRVFYEAHDVRLGVFPMGIDAQGFSNATADPGVQGEAAALRASDDQRLIVGVDRLDYTKGIPRRLLALERLLQQAPELRDRVCLVQVAVPSRENVGAYQDYRRQVDELVGRINGAYTTVRNVPIHYLYRSLSAGELVALYRAADVMLVTPIRDGMNLVAKEFIAARNDEDGVLVLSEFAGAASELGDALLVNPYDLDQVAATLKQALGMHADERRGRMRALRERVFDYDVARWADSFINTLKSVTQVPTLRKWTTPRESELLVEQLCLAPALLLLLDYDGTLVPIARTPQLARPDPEVMELLRALASRPSTSLHIISGRTRDDLERWLGELPIGLHAEHGFWSRRGPAEEWFPAFEPREDWKAKILPILDQFTAATPGSWIENKTASIAWHYRLSDPEFGVLQAKELRLHLGELLGLLPVQVIPTKKVVEVRLSGVHKGSIAGPLTQNFSGAVLAMGDDRTDEDLFAALPPGSYAVHIGPAPSRAPYRLVNALAVRKFLRGIVLGPAPKTEGAGPRRAKERAKEREPLSRQ